MTGTDTVNERELVLQILLSVTRDGVYSHVAISDVLTKYQYLSKQERSFITRLCEGTLEKRITIDYLLNQFSTVKVNKMKPVIRNILRMGTYQLIYMDAIPDSAVCNEAVKLAAKRGFSQLKGFVNGVLRNLARSREKIKWPDEKKEPVLYLSVKYAIPEWMILQWEQDYGREKTGQILEAFCQEGKTAIRTNLSKITPAKLKERFEARGLCAEEIRLPAYPDFNYAFYLSGYDYLLALPEFKEGLFSVQDVSSMLVAEFAEPKSGALVIDVCASPGGKSLHLAERLKGTGLVLARDLTEEKVRKIEENIARTGAENIKAEVMDARILSEENIGQADLVIADLPCSGLGVLRKKTDLRDKMTPEKEAELARLQRQILPAAAQYVKPGGTLIYSTCTMNRAENEENTAWLLSREPEFILKTQRQFFPDEGMQDGFYIAKLKRKEKA